MFIAVPDRFENTQAGAKCLSSPSLHDSRANEMIGGGEIRQPARQTLRGSLHDDSLERRFGLRALRNR
jgi:hypothetical protein